MHQMPVMINPDRGFRVSAAHNRIDILGGVIASSQNANPVSIH